MGVKVKNLELNGQVKLDFNSLEFVCEQGCGKGDGRKVKAKKGGTGKVVVKTRTIYKAHDYGDEVVFNGIRASDLFKGEFGTVDEDAQNRQNGKVNKVEENKINANQLECCVGNAKSFCGDEHKEIGKNKNKIDANQFENENIINKNPLNNKNLN